MRDEPEVTAIQHVRHVAGCVSDQLDLLAEAGTPDDALLSGLAMAAAERVERIRGTQSVVPWFYAQLLQAKSQAGEN